MSFAGRGRARARRRPSPPLTDDARFALHVAARYWTLAHGYADVPARVAIRIIVREQLDRFRASRWAALFARAYEAPWLLSCRVLGYDPSAGERDVMRDAQELGRAAASGAHTTGAVVPVRPGLGGFGVSAGFLGVTLPASVR